MSTKDKVIEALQTPLAKDIKLLIAFAILKTSTLADDEVLDNIDDVTDALAENIAEIAELEPTEKDAKQAGINILKAIAAQTKTKWDDRAINILDFIV